MKKGLSWITVVFSILAIPYTWSNDLFSSFIGTVYFLIVIGLMVLNIREKK